MKKYILTICEVLLIFGFLAYAIASSKRSKPVPVPTSTPSPTVTMTPTPTITPTPTPVPTPTPSPMAVDSGHTFKPYTGYWAYNAKGTAQHKLQKVAETAANGIRVVMDPEGNYRYCVALGTAWAGGHPEHIGRCLDVYMVNGAVLRCVLADVKRQEDTKNNANRYGKTNNDILEFIVDEKVLSQAVKACGNVSKAGSEFEGDVAQIIVFDMWIEGFGK